MDGARRKGVITFVPISEGDVPETSDDYPSAKA